MKYLLDTCVISDFVKGEPNTQTRLRATDPAECAVSSITVMELDYGLRLNPRQANPIAPVITDLLNTMAVLDFDRETARYTAAIRVTLKQQGQPIGAYDVLIAATALRHGLIVVTANQREFERIPDLNVENWRNV